MQPFHPSYLTALDVRCKVFLAKDLDWAYTNFPIGNLRVSVLIGRSVRHRWIRDDRPTPGDLGKRLPPGSGTRASLQEERFPLVGQRVMEPAFLEETVG
jgi:hypothetical protein